MEMMEGMRVKVKPGKEHDPMTKAATGTILLISTPALGIKFDDMPGVHKWYTGAELEVIQPHPMDEDMGM